MSARAILAANIRKLREAAGLSQETLADLAGIDRTYVSSLERQRYAASIDMIEKLAAVLGCTAAELLSPD